ncbi:MAG: PLP-dependent cysteine synthase family protein [Chloroflexota bacterium]|nr:PLP-dependent cysteine synthase family protein [Chloroflexota bacterium]
MPYAQNIQKFVDRYPALQAIGNTPLVELDLPWDLDNTHIYAKFEQLNPGGSIKDRPVLRMLAEAIISGNLKEGKTILDATSGNAGIAYAMVGAILGFPVELVMPENASDERKKRLNAHGANLIFTDAQLGYDEALYEVKRRYEQNPEKYFYCDQYSNTNNPLAHYETTAVELLEQAPFITHFVGGVGTGGTISGIGRKLKEANSSIEVICIDFEEWPGVEGLKPLSEGHIIPDTFDRSVVDRMINVDVVEAYEVSSELARRGIFVGQSSGAYLLGVRQVAEELTSGHVVTIFNDIGERYFSTSMWG